MRTTRQLSITLSNDMAGLVRAEVASGEYASESEVIRDGLCSLAVPARSCAAVLAAAIILVGACDVHAATPPQAGHTHIVVSGAVDYAYTRKTASCGIKNGQLVFFAAPDTNVEPAFPVTAGMLENGVWHMQIHPPEADRDFENENAGGVLIDPLPGGNWRIELHNIKMPEEVTMNTDYAYVNGTITCTSIQTLPK